MKTQNLQLNLTNWKALGVYLIVSKLKFTNRNHV